MTAAAARAGVVSAQHVGDIARSAEPIDSSGAAPAPAAPPALREPAKAAPVIGRSTPKPRREPKPPKEPRAVATKPTGAPRLVTVEEAMSGHHRKREAQPRGRKVKRIVRRLDAWSVLKVSFIFYSCIYIVSMVAIVLLWNLASGAGVIDNIESFIEDLGAFETFRFDADRLLQGTALGGAVLALLATGLTALGSVLFNLISDLVGGIRMTVIEEPGSKPLVHAKEDAKLAGRIPTASDTVSEPSGGTSGL